MPSDSASVDGGFRHPTALQEVSRSHPQRGRVRGRDRRKTNLVTSIICVTIIQMERTFDHEKLDVYQIELQFIAWLTDFFLEVSKSRAARCRELFEQLDRASLSALLNTAEGNGKRQGRQRAKFFDDARGSAIECAACLDAAVAKRFVSPDRIQPAKEMLGRVVAMLTRLVDRFDTEEFLHRSAI